jgi:serine/threonine protein kinase
VVDRRQLRPHDELAFVREVACLLRCSAHPGVLSLFEDYQDPYNGGSVGSGVVSELQRHYLVTELLGGGDLFDRVVRDVVGK